MVSKVWQSKGTHIIKASSGGWGEENACTNVDLLLFPLLYHLGPQPVGWCHPHSDIRGGSSPLCILMENALTDTPRGVLF
jgi:hypothetical protein